jgi:hypothetical protein
MKDVQRKVDSETYTKLLLITLLESVNLVGHY